MSFNEVQSSSSAQNPAHHAASEALLRGAGLAGGAAAAAESESFDPYQALRMGSSSNARDAGTALALGAAAGSAEAVAALKSDGTSSDYLRLMRDPEIGCFPTHEPIGGWHPGSGSWLPDVTLSNLPEADKTGFQQEAPDNDHGFFHQISRIFGHHDTLDDEVRQSVVDHLSPQDKAEYDKEERAMESYRIRMATEASLVGYMEPPPKCPMHDQVDAETKQAEAGIARDVRSHMTVTDLNRVDEQMKEYDQALEKYYRSGGFGQPPEPGNALKDYWDRLKETTGKYVDDPGSACEPNPYRQPPIWTETPPDPTEPPVWRDPGFEPHAPIRLPDPTEPPVWQDPGFCPDKPNSPDIPIWLLDQERKSSSYDDRANRELNIYSSSKAQDQTNF